MVDPDGDGMCALAFGVLRKAKKSPSAPVVMAADAPTPMRRDRRRTATGPFEVGAEGGLVTGAAVIAACLEEDETRDEMSPIECAHAAAPEPVVIARAVGSFENTRASSS
jgi:hypothetical protein